MKRLVRMLLINWYRIEQEAIEIRGHTALIGPNASGKSSLLDAVQAVLVGGHKEWWRPNASAGEKSTRSLRDYCLGVVRDPDNQDLSREFRPRQQSITYLVLVFHEDGGDPISVGLALHARLEESGEQIDGRFIARGLDLVLSDLTDRRTDGEVTPKPWPRMREELRSRAGSRLILEASPEKFRQQICAVLSDGRRFLDRRRFLRAFRNAITFAPIKNVSDFVRSHILEERDIQVKSLQQALRNYREIRKRTEDAERREKALADIDGLYRKAEQAEQLLLGWRWVEQEAAFNALEAELEPLRESIEKRSRKLAELADEMERLDQAWALADEQLQEATKRLAETDVEQRRQTIQAKRKTAETLLQQARGTLEEARRGLGQAHRVLDHAMLFDDNALEDALRALLPLILPDEDLMPDTWPLDAAEVVTRLGRVQPLLVQTLEKQKENRGDMISQVRDLERGLTELSERIKRLETGGSDLSPATLRLQAMLSEHGIQAVPLCDRVEVADEAWRDALEAFLGGHREALLVDPAEVRDAIALYRGEGKRLGIHGSRIINTRKTGEREHRAAPGSLAEVIRSDDRHAIAYINRRAGNVLRVETEQDLLVHERAITSDGMLATGGAITRLRPLDPMLGRGARERTLQTLKTRFADQSEGYAKAKNEGELLERFIDEILSPFKGRVEGLPDLVALSEQRQAQQAQIRQLDEQEAALQDDTEYRRLNENVESAKKRRDEADSQRTGARARNTELQKAQQADQTKLADKQGESEIAAGQRRQLEAVPGFDAQSAGERLEELEGQMLLKDEGPDSWRALGQEAQQRAARQGTAMRNRREQAREDLKEYLAHWPSVQPPSMGLADDHVPMSTWVLAHLTELRETALAQYAREAKTALDEAETAFRADFVGKLQENLRLLETQRKELNANLRRRPFHGQYYSFTKKPDQELEPVLHWVDSWEPDQSADVGGLFDMTNDPSHPHHEGIARVKALLLDAGDKDPLSSGWDERLSDYRRYYHFDVRMTDDQDGQKNAELLSRRLGKGSGGEHQSPFYVAIGAALAAAYRIERDEQAGGIHLEWGSGAASQDLHRIRIADADKLAAWLGVPRAIDHARIMSATLDLLVSDAPDWLKRAYTDSLRSWRLGKPALRINHDDPEEAQTLFRIAIAVSRGEQTNLDLRRFSVQLLGDSKAVESRLSRLAALLRRNPDWAEFEENAELFRTLGLEKFPPPLLIKGPLHMDYGGRDWDITELRPFVGLSPDQILTLEPAQMVPYLLTIENLASFQRHVREIDDQGVILYTAGFPSPAMVQVLNRLDVSLPPACPFFHWGDRDLGGLRIFAKVEQAYDLHRLQPHRMGMESENTPRFTRDTLAVLRRQANGETAAGTLAGSWCENPRLGPLEQERQDPMAPLTNDS